MKTRIRWLRLALVFALLILFAFVVARLTAPREEPVYQGNPLSFWVTKVVQMEEYNGAPEDAVAAIRAIGPKAIPFLLDWMPKRKSPRPAFVEWLSGWFASAVAQLGPWYRFRAWRDAHHRNSQSKNLVHALRQVTGGFEI